LNGAAEAMLAFARALAGERPSQTTGGGGGESSGAAQNSRECGGEEADPRLGGGGGGELSGGPQNTLEDAGGVADLPAGARSQGTLEGVHLDEEGDGRWGNRLLLSWFRSLNDAGPLNSCLIQKSCRVLRNRSRLGDSFLGWQRNGVQARHLSSCTSTVSQQWGAGKEKTCPFCEFGVKLPQPF